MIIQYVCGGLIRKIVDSHVLSDRDRHAPVDVVEVSKVGAVLGEILTETQTRGRIQYKQISVCCAEVALAHNGDSHDDKKSSGQGNVMLYLNVPSISNHLGY